MSSQQELLSTVMKRTSEWIFSQEIPSDVTVQTGEASFALHKLPLISKCGYIRKLVSESNEADPSEVNLPGIPGGAEAFELAAKFCYGINFEISTENVAMLRCVAEYLEMTEDYAVGNLVGRTEAYLNGVVLKSLPGAIIVLHKTETLAPVAEKVKLASRCIDAIAFITCKESQSSLPGKAGEMYGSNPEAIIEWWAEDLTILRIDVFHRVLMAMIGRGFKQYALGPILMLYAQKSLKGLGVFGNGQKKIEPEQVHEKRIVLETIVSLLPRQKNAMPVSFLSMLLRAAMYLETTVACRIDLEKRIALQLEQAVLDDLLIPSYFFTGDTIFDVNTVQRIMMNYINRETEGPRSGFKVGDEYQSATTNLSDLEQVGRLMESYLAEIASDRNLSVSKFIGLAELVPEQSRVTEDGMYRAIDIYLKAHPVLSDLERKKVCSLMNCQKLSREACAHAAQNERLPVQTVVQVLYYEQQRLRESVSGSVSPQLPSKISMYSPDPYPVSDELSSLRRENEELKVELIKMKVRLQELERSSVKSNVGSSLHQSSAPSADKPPLPRKSFMSSVSKKLGRLYPFLRADVISTAGGKGRTKAPKTRRHSIS
ncbi:hypothetical protein SAY86_021868 [Trapa natans]|uniref:Uncharacterized protein n=1 Tax=Trapa natans TaxID=22666 RepID=A0AAN7MVA1_TRANT|nr:hypothetical protein SAY86_021868 [Trapa natans]